MSRAPVASAWWRPALAILAGAALVVATGLLVDLEPRVDSEFFFSSGDPALAVDEKIQERFGALSQMVVLVSSPDVDSPDHLEAVARLTARLEEVSGVRAVRSLASGPDDLADARESPLWSRLLLAGDGSTSFVIVELLESHARSVVSALETIVSEQAGPEVELQFAGVPYTVEVMRRELVRDFSVFSGAAVIVFGAAILLIFRSGWILVGTLVTCLGSVATTLLLLHTVGLGIGLLTANLTTIVFVLAQSHVVFMASNWQDLARQGGDSRPRELAALARRKTLRASLGSATTTLLGFASLVFVPARPLQELGVGGSIGAVVALASAYLALPVFLERARPRPVDASRGRVLALTSPRRAAAVAVFCGVLALGLPRLETDPSLLAYFDEDGDVHAALHALDRSGGSSPLSLVVQRNGRERLDTEESVDRMWGLQRALEADAAVGRLISLPVLLAEAERFELSFLLTTDWTLDLLGPETTGAFVTRDRRQALYLLQMAESQREASRTEVVDRLRDVAGENGFDAPLAGGIYALQGRLADLVARSVVWSLAALVVLFFGVAAFAAGSLRVGVAASVATGLVPLATLGGFGGLGVPLDVIAAPAASVGFGLAADAALHLLSAWRRRSDGEPAERWRAAAREQWRGVARSTGIVALGFGLFALSSFPPTRRFGFGVAVATAIGAAAALWVLPAIAGRMGRADTDD